MSAATSEGRCSCGSVIPFGMYHSCSTTPLPGPPDSCICGHASAHHQVSLSGPPPCDWRGCGCPRFVAAVPTEPTGEPK